MDLRKLVDMYLEIPLLLIIIYYFYTKDNLINLELLIYGLVTIMLFINIILSLEMIKVRYVSFNSFF
uniref:Uncharacterized protein n=1 Tax=viral metagenome TaxID=1070528 RepID=A0A6C0AY69_9ZZZZ